MTKATIPTAREDGFYWVDSGWRSTPEVAELRAGRMLYIGGKTRREDRVRFRSERLEEPDYE